MGQGQSKDELLYQQVSYGNAEGIKTLHREGAGLEWRDKDAKTPLIVACMNPRLYNVAKTLIELGANINAFRPGRHGGTPLHHAAKRGFDSIVKLLLLHGANPLVLNDDCLTALEVARAKGHSNVVRTIESHLCLFSGWLCEFHGPGFLEVVAPQLVSKKVWVVVLPVGSRTLAKPYKLELAIYSRLQDAQPRTVIGLWNADLQDPKLHQSDPSVTVVDRITKTRVKLGPASENDKQQLTWFSNACKGIPQVSPAFLQNNVPTGPPTAPPVAEDTELAMAISASLQSAMQERPPFSDTQPSFEASSSSSAVNTGNHGFLGTPNPNTSDSELVQEANPDGNTQHLQSHVNASALDLNPSAPPIANEILADGPIQYPSIDLSPVDMASPDAEKLPKGEKNAGGRGSSCVICLDAPAEGACIPCGHVAGCMSCLNEVKSKKWGCPVCRAKIDQVIKLYHV
ncbi:putative E3 ubiquitin-protein ligase XBAT34 [Glycine soja]|uniref:Putative E3 ubiquitin-protein ligase XBAT35 n=1 Tax=Glycine soja TaxID=3848 RepID=A0A0B2RFA9_GLYSO|nr:putative E3 ubiquitin-protein ligase XBAT34 [Glycine soja]KHN30573.1 Putative E3 ubiquitin-protein ligase XBAT35 [Glycine soja]RZB87847.1 putative E3 ubiquitin-protein ligase XBAT35 [Glycine soja]